MKYFKVAIDGAPPIKIAENTALRELISARAEAGGAGSAAGVAAGCGNATVAGGGTTVSGVEASGGGKASGVASACGGEIVAAYVGNRMVELSEAITGDCAVRFISALSPEGRRICERSLIFMLVKAVRDLYPNRRVLISHTVRFDIYFEIPGESEILPEEIDAIEKRMREMSAKRIPFNWVEIPADRAETLFREKERQNVYNAIRERHRPHVMFYEFDGMTDYSYGCLAPDSGYLDRFSLLYRYPGAIMTMPQGVLEMRGADKYAMYKDVPKMLAVFAEYKRWGRILGIESVGELNKAVRTGDAPDIIRVAEALQENKISQIAEQIAGTTDRKKIVLISGPSSSGKTTFANRLSIQLRVNGFKTKIISMDNYYLNKENIPLDGDGNADLESPDALDVSLFAGQMRALLAGHTVNAPVYNFKKGRRDERALPLSVGDNEILIVEGIHGLNPKVTASVPKEFKHRIYISALTSLNIDDHNRIPTTDARLIRRIVRDHAFRGTKAAETISMWPSVRNGEEEYIFPYQESCDSMFNSGLIYELSAMKENAQALLSEIMPDAPEFIEAARLHKFLSYFAQIVTDDIPRNSILREFIGGSCFRV